MLYLTTDAGDQLATDSGDLLCTDSDDPTTPTINTTTTLTADPPSSVNQGTLITFTATVSGLLNTSTVVISGTNPSTAGDSVDFTVTITAGPDPTGTVEFYADGTLIGTGTLSGMSATFATSALTNGAHSLTADYLGDGFYSDSASSALNYTIVAPDAPDKPPKPPKPWKPGGRPRMKDYSALLFDPVYAELGVPAVFTAEGTAGEVEITVIDETRAKTQTSAGVEVRSVGPIATARIYELTANGIAREDYKGATLTFNDRTWTVRNFEIDGSPNGEDLGLVRFLLMAAYE